MQAGTLREVELVPLREAASCSRILPVLRHRPLGTGDAGAGAMTSRMPSPATAATTQRGQLEPGIHKRRPGSTEAAPAASPPNQKRLGTLGRGRLRRVQEHRDEVVVADRGDDVEQLLRRVHCREGLPCRVRHRRGRACNSSAATSNDLSRRPLTAAGPSLTRSISTSDNPHSRAISTCWPHRTCSCSSNQCAGSGARVRVPAGCSSTGHGRRTPTSGGADRDGGRASPKMLSTSPSGRRIPRANNSGSRGSSVSRRTGSRGGGGSAHHTILARARSVGRGVGGAMIGAVIGPGIIVPIVAVVIIVVAGLVLFKRYLNSIKPDRERRHPVRVHVSRPPRSTGSRPRRGGSCTRSRATHSEGSTTSSSDRRGSSRSPRHWRQMPSPSPQPPSAETVAKGAIAQGRPRRPPPSVPRWSRPATWPCTGDAATMPTRRSSRSPTEHRRVGSPHR